MAARTASRKKVPAKDAAKDAAKADSKVQAAAPSAGQDGRADASRAFAVEAARLAANTRCHNVIVLDVRELSPVTDYFIIASGTSARQMRTVVDEVEELGEGSNYRSIARSGYEGDSWIVLDFVDVIVHVFSDEARMFYDLDNLWGDAKRVAWQPAESAAKPAAH